MTPNPPNQELGAERVPSPPHRCRLWGTPLPANRVGCSEGPPSNRVEAIGVPADSPGLSQWRRLARSLLGGGAGEGAGPRAALPRGCGGPRGRPALSAEPRIGKAPGGYKMAGKGGIAAPATRSCALRRHCGGEGRARDTAPPARSAAARSPRRRPAPLRPRRLGRAAAASVSVRGARAAAAAENGCQSAPSPRCHGRGARSPAARPSPLASRLPTLRGALRPSRAQGSGGRGGARGEGEGEGGYLRGEGGGDSAGRVRVVDPNRRHDPCPREVAAPGWEVLWAVDLGDRVPPHRHPGPHPHPTSAWEPGRPVLTATPHKEK